MNYIKDLPCELKSKIKSFESNLFKRFVFSTSGRYCIDIYPRNGKTKNYEEVMILEKDLLENEKKSQVIKIHKQFGHASKENINKLINNAGLLDKRLNAIMENVVQSWDMC